MARLVETSASGSIRGLGRAVEPMVLAALLFAAAPVAADQMMFYGDASEDSLAEFGQEGGVGNMILWNSELQDEQGGKVGTTSGSCIQVDADGTHVYNIILDHEGHGRINLNGVQPAEPATATLTIVGGAGDYEGISGMMKTHPVEDRGRFRYEIDYRTD